MNREDKIIEIQTELNQLCLPVFNDFLGLVKTAPDYLVYPNPGKIEFTINVCRNLGYYNLGYRLYFFESIDIVYEKFQSFKQTLAFA